MHNPLNPAPEWTAVNMENGTALPSLKIPGPERAREVSWDSALAKSRGIFGCRFRWTRGFLLFAQLQHDPRADLGNYAERGWRMIGIVSATRERRESFISAMFRVLES